MMESQYDLSKIMKVAHRRARILKIPQPFLSYKQRLSLGMKHAWNIAKEDRERRQKIAGEFSFLRGGDTICESTLRQESSNVLSLYEHANYLHYSDLPYESITQKELFASTKSSKQQQDQFQPHRIHSLTQAVVGRQ